MTRRILLLVSSMSSGGAERVAANLANAWDARGDEVSLVITYSGAGECFYHLAPGVKLHYLATPGRVHVRNARSYVVRFMRLRRMIRRERPDVVVSFLTNVNVAAVLGALWSGVPVVVCEHIYPPMLPVGKAWSALRRWAYPLAEQVTMLTSEGLSWLNEHVPAARGFVIPNPVPFPLPIAEPRLDPAQVVGHDRKVLLAVGRLAQQKGFDWLLAAFSRVADANRSWDLVILGEGSERAALEARIGELGLGYRVFLPGRAGNIGDWYALADLYAMSSRFEGFPNTLGEAMAYGCAAVSYDCDTGPRDIIRDGIDGVLVRPVGDVGALAAALGTLMRDDELRARMSREAVTVRERYSIDAVLARWDALFAQVSAAG
jgi:glycosyltransferase involved in cell wall biosynthesis